MARQTPLFPGNNHPPAPHHPSQWRRLGLNFTNLHNVCLSHVVALRITIAIQSMEIGSQFRTGNRYCIKRKIHSFGRYVGALNQDSFVSMSKKCFAFEKVMKLQHPSRTPRIDSNLVSMHIVWQQYHHEVQWHVRYPMESRNVFV